MTQPMQSLKAVLTSKNAGGSGTTALTGGGTSEDETFSFGYSQMRGKRPSMEDFQDAKIAKVGDQIIGLFGVFDGHGGSKAAEFVRDHLFTDLIEHPAFATDPKQAITETFTATDKKYLDGEVGQNRDAGSTASTAVLMGKKLYVANVGDSRAVIFRGKKGQPLSKDHKPNNRDERERIEAMGGSVMWAGTWRVGGVLAVSRAFGDRLLKRYVEPIPDIEVVDVGPEDEFLLLASDGLWDVINDQEACQKVETVLDAEEAAKCLTEEAFKRGSADNITCIVVRFHQNRQ